MAVEREALRERGREHVAGEVDHLALGDEVEDLRFEDVDAGVDRVREDLTPGRFLEESLDRSVGVGDHDAELERVLHSLRTASRPAHRSSCCIDERGEIDVGQHVTRDHHERVIELDRRVADRPCGPQRAVLGGVPHRDAEVGAITEVVADLGCRGTRR